MSIKTSKSEPIKKAIETQFKKDHEFFKEKHNRHNFRDATLDLLGINDKKGKNLYSVVYKRVLKAKRKYNDEYTETRFRLPKNNSEFKLIKIKAEPQGPSLEPVKTPVEKIKDEIIEEQPQIAKIHQDEIDSDLEHMEQASHHIPEGSVSHFWDGVWLLVQLKWPNIEGLSEVERKTLGKMWQPFFEKYMSEKFLLLGVPIIVTLGIFGKHIREARRIQKEKQLEEKENEKIIEKKEASQ